MSNFTSTALGIFVGCSVYELARQLVAHLAASAEIDTARTIIPCALYVLRLY